VLLGEASEEGLEHGGLQRRLTNTTAFVVGGKGLSSLYSGLVFCITKRDLFVERIVTVLS
jgi:hypothetical protein